MKREITFTEDCEFISNSNEEVLEKLLTEMFVDFVNKLCGKEVVEIKL